MSQALKTLAAIEKATAGVNENRTHLGASVIGRECGREVWLMFRWALDRSWGGRMLRLFARGKREENIFALFVYTN